MTIFFNKLKKHCFGRFSVHFPNFGGKKNFSGKSGSATHNFILYEFLVPWPNLEKTNDTIPRKRLDRRTNGRRTEGRTNPISQDPFGYCRGSNKLKIQSFSTYVKFFGENFPWYIHLRVGITCAYRDVRKVSFSENFA